jgi:hypothetical protein
MYGVIKRNLMKLAGKDAHIKLYKTMDGSSNLHIPYVGCEDDRM